MSWIAAHGRAQRVSLRCSIVSTRPGQPGQKKTMDILSPILHTLRLTAGRYTQADLAAPWGIRFLRRVCVMFHAVEHGSVWLAVEEHAEPLLLGSGDLVLLPHGHEHSLTDRRNGRSRVVEFSDGGRFKFSDRPGERARFVCGEIHLQDMVAHPLLAHLPPILLIRSLPGQAGAESLQLTLRSLALEAARDDPGVHSVITRLTEVLFVQALRHWIAHHAPARAGWLAGLADPAIARALALIHQQPGVAWTVGDLAQGVAMSRAVFARRFTELVGEPPIAYLTRWRMHLAATALRDQPHASITEIADGAGYDSVAAFNRAFRKIVGTTPGRWRRSAEPEASTSASTAA
jgi:AraC-like DNA-binding protein